MSSKASMIHCQKASVTKCTSTQGNSKGKKPLRIILASFELLSFPSWLTCLFYPHGCRNCQIPLALLGWMVCFSHVDSGGGLTDAAVWLRKLNWSWRCGGNNSNRTPTPINTNVSTDVVYSLHHRKWWVRREELRGKIIYNFHQRCEAPLPLLCHCGSLSQLKCPGNRTIISVYSSGYIMADTGQRKLFSLHPQYDLEEITVKAQFMFSPFLLC